MLKELDTLIGFVVVMSVVSLLIMIVTQIFSALLGLRGKNLADSLEAAFAKLVPEIDHADLQALIHQTLTDPAISDSFLSMKKKGKGLWGKMRALWMTASAIRPDELLEHIRKEAGSASGGPSTELGMILGQVGQAVQKAAAQVPPAHQQVLTAAAETVRQAETQLSQTGTQIVETVQAALEKIKAAQAAAQPAGPGELPPELATALDVAKRARGAAETAFKPAPTGSNTAVTAKRILDALRAQIGPTPAAGPLQSPDAAAQAAEAELKHLEKWFDSAQDRASQWFAMHTRMLTIAAAFIAAFGLQLDTIELLRRLSADPDVRAKLVARADAVERQGQKVADQAFNLTAHSQIMTGLRKQFPEIPASLDSLPPTVSSLGEAEKWLSESLNKQGGNFQAIERAYHQAALVRTISDSQAEFKESLAELKGTGLQLLPDPYIWCRCFWPVPHLVGILLSAGLLSLGSPFWFYLLKQLANLRPVLADAIDDKPKQAAA